MNRAQRTLPAARFLAAACLLLALALPVSAQDTPAAAEDTNQTAGATNGITNNITISNEGNVTWNGSINANGDNPIVMIGKDVEVTVLAQAVRAHLQKRVLLHGNRTIVFG